MLSPIRVLIASLAAPLLLGAVQPALAAYVFPPGAVAQAQAVANINGTVAPSPLTQSTVLNLGTSASAAITGSPGSANASIDLGAGELKAYGSTTKGFTSQAVAWEFVTFDGNDDVDFAFDIDGTLSNTFPSGMVYVEAAVRLYDVTSWTSYFQTTGGIQFAAENGTGSPFPYLEASGFATQAVRGSNSGGCTLYVIANCTVDQFGTAVPVNLSIGGTLEAQQGQLYLLELILTTSTYNQQLGINLQTGDFANTATFSFSNLNGLNFESSSGEFLAAPVPVPAAVWLFGSAIGLLGVIRRKRA
ncbi:MAG: hypothetical protein ABL989_14265 [Gammaproteobacteria bacterium]